MSAFGRLHPIVNFIFFAFVLVLTMVWTHPVLQCLGLVLAGAAVVACLGWRGLWNQLRFALPLMLFTALINPILSHEGRTVLFYFPWDAACTVESLLYGLSVGLRLGAVLLWFAVWNCVFTTDKFVFLFGRALPSVSLVISMGLSLVPRLLRRFRQVSDVQRCLKPDSKGLRHVGRCVSIVITWALENALDTADSMRGRGYGLRPRSFFSIYRFTLRDGLALCGLLPLCALSTTAAAIGWADWSYYPVLSGMGGWELLLAALSFSLLALYPLILEGKEALAWRVSN